MLDWVNRNGKILLAMGPLQSFAGTFVSIFFAIYMETLGVPLWQTGLVMSGGLVMSTLQNLVAGYIADRIGRRRLLVVLGMIPTLAGFAFTLTTNTSVLIAVSVISCMGMNVYGASQMLERVILAQCSTDENRTKLYAYRSTIWSLARSVGSLFTGMIVVFQGWGYTELSAYKVMFAVYTALNLAIVILYSLLDESAEIEEETEVEVTLSPETRRYLVLFSVLFGLDALGGALIGQSLVAYWFFERFGLGMDKIGMIFSASSIMAAISFMLAVRISKKIGLINTMVFSHLPANIIMMMLPYMPNLEVSLGFYMVRGLLSMMDVPTRQSYTMAIIKPEERSKFQGLLNIPRNLMMVIGPTIAAYIMQFIGVGLPFLIAGGIKSFYDIALWFTFKDIKPPEEED